MSRGKEATAKDRPANPCAFCGARVPVRPRADNDCEICEPKLCRHCEGGDSFHFTVRETMKRTRPFAESRWCRPGIVDAGIRLRFGLEPRRRR